MNEEKKKLVILSGPTAAGKTGLSIELAKRIGGEIISADSMQVYKDMDIGTAKIKESEMEGIRHHLIDIITPFEPWSVSNFKDHALEAMEGIYERGSIPIVVGGTGFYIQALLYDVDFNSASFPGDEKECAEINSRIKEIYPDCAYISDPAGLRAALTAFYEKEGAKALYKILERVDPLSAESIHENNVKRVMRAIEFYISTGLKISEHNLEERSKESAYDSTYFVLTLDREKLYERIDLRVDKMIGDGLVDEVKRLKAQGCDRSLVSMQGLGYKEILAYLDGEISFEEAVRILKRDTRHFAKRQLAWFRREREVIWIDKDKYPDEQAILAEMMKYIYGGHI